MNKTERKTFIKGIVAACAILCAGFMQNAEAATLTVPYPTASKGTYSSYVKVSWSRVSGAQAYIIKRGTSSSYSNASQLTRINKGSTTSYFDSSATSGRTYYYWVCPVANGYYSYNSSKYDYGYCSTPYSISGSASVKVGSFITLTFSGGSADWYLSNSCGYLSNRSGRSVSLQGWTPGTVTVYATYNGRTYSKAISVTSDSKPSSSSGSISGSSSLRYGNSAKYYLYIGGKKVTSSAVSWSRSGLATMQDKGSYGLLKATSRPVTTHKVTVIAQYNGKRYTKTVTIGR